MIKFTIKDKHGNNTLGIGLSHENLKRLKEGRPIAFDVTQLIQETIHEIFIFSGNTEKDMYNEMKDHIGLHTKIIGEPPEKGSK